MSNQTFKSQLLSFVLLLVLTLFIREYITQTFIQSGIDSYNSHMWLGIIVNIVLILISYLFIRRNDLFKIAGLKDTHLQKGYLLIFPVAYLVLLNGAFSDELDLKFVKPYIPILAIYSISIGVSEEMSIRGFLQSFLIKNFGNSKKQVKRAVFIASLFFGLLHLINFNKGLYGELSQVFFATFIGVMFGALLLVTRRIYPLMIIHALIDFVAKLDSAGLPIKEKVSDPMSAENAVLSVILVLPCLLYGLFLLNRFDINTISEPTHSI